MNFVVVIRREAKAYVENRLSTFANILYVYRRYLRLSLLGHEMKVNCLIYRCTITRKIENRRLRRANAEIHSALAGGTSKEIWPRPKLDYKPGFEGGTVLEFCTASVLRTQHRQDAESPARLLAFGFVPRHAPTVY